MNGRSRSPHICTNVQNYYIKYMYVMSDNTLNSYICPKAQYNVIPQLTKWPSIIRKAKSKHSYTTILQHRCINQGYKRHQSQWQLKGVLATILGSYTINDNIVAKACNYTSSDIPKLSREDIPILKHNYTSDMNVPKCYYDIVHYITLLQS